MSITASQVKELRDRSGVGMMDCKKALQEANGDTKKAMEVLRKNGIDTFRTRTNPGGDFVFHRFNWCFNSTQYCFCPDVSGNHA